MLYCVYSSEPVVRVFVVSALFFFKQKTAYDMRISDWSSDVCSSDLPPNTLVTPDSSMAFGMRGTSICSADMAPAQQPVLQRDQQAEIGRASCRERVCQYV